ncbi:MAG: aminodeoxychorismate synthase component I [Candidatus Latescibacteria bacterium]|nr:aminodeoxychorismate synthase component I [Candidatus Latescibacterota bacterium]
MNPSFLIHRSAVVLSGRDPFLIVRAWGDRVEVDDRERGRTERWIGDPFEVVRSLLNDSAVEGSPDAPPFRSGGVVGYLGYGLRRWVEPVPVRTTDEQGVPDLWLGWYREVKVLESPNNERATGLSLMNEEPAGRLPSSAASNYTRDVYLRTVQRVKEYIAAGDVYQVNLAQRLALPYSGAASGLYRRLQRINPAPFATYLDCGDFQVVSASPEQFLFFDPSSRRVETRPIKGTRPRGRTQAEDESLAEGLMTSEKDGAEHLMIVDLERNDLGRVCNIGSVCVPALRTLERHPTVWHLVSTVQGRLRPDCDRVDLLRATFPGGSITGAPKIRAMEIIDELEPTARGVYTGAIGYLGFDGSLDLNIAIRTVVIKDGAARFHVGGGIVADSDPAAEYEETLDKARAIVWALQSGDGWSVVGKRMRKQSVVSERQ